MNFEKKEKKRWGFSTPKGVAGPETCLGTVQRGAAGIKKMRICIPMA